MLSLPRALALSFGQLTDPRILRVLAKTAAITLAVFAVAGWALSFAFAAMLDRVGLSDSTGAAGVLAVLTTIAAAWFLFRIVALAVMPFFAGEVVEAVESRYYAQEASLARQPGWRSELATSAQSTLRAILFNLIALPFAIALLVTGVGAALVFLTVNAILLGRDLQDMVWLRYRPDAAVRPPLDFVSRFLLGAVIAGMMLVPFLNLIAPVIGAASATHMVHGARRGLRDA